MEPVQVIYKGKDFLILNKPAGMLVHGIRGKESGELTLADWLVRNYPAAAAVGDNPAERPGIVHRLDRETSGVIVAALSQPMFEYLKGLFQRHEVRKTYIALVAGDMKDDRGMIDKPIGLKSGTVKRSVHGTKMVKDAVTEYAVIRRLKISNAPYTLIEITPRTGRTHQIRVHLNFIGHPVMGDKLYGGKRSDMKGLERHFLHAAAIEFPLPDGNRAKFETGLPIELERLLASDR